MAIQPFPLHPAQRDIYTDQLIDPTSAQYNIGGYIRLKGAVDVEKLHKAVASAPLAFDAFKIRFDLHESEPYCYFDQDYQEARMKDIDFSSRAKPMEEAISWMQERFNTPFKLEKQNTLFEQCLLKIADNEYWFFGRYHHLMADGYGFVVWIQYMAQKYKSLVAGDDVEFSYPSYLEELVKSNENFNSAEYESDASYWKEKIDSRPERLLLKKLHKSSKERRSITYILNLTQEQRAIAHLKTTRLHDHLPGALTCFPYCLQLF